VEISYFGIGYVSTLGDCLDGCSMGNVDLWLFLVVFQVLFIGNLLIACQHPLLLWRSTYCNFSPYAITVCPLGDKSLGKIVRISYSAAVVHNLFWPGPLIDFW